MFKGKKEKPALILKTSSAGFSIMDRNELKRKINQIKKSLNFDNFPNIYILHGDLTDEEMNQLYNHPKVKTHITFTHGEGFGRPLLEASFSGKPIMAPVSTGQADFLEKEYVVEIPHSMTKVPDSSFPKEYQNPEAVWSVVNYNMAARLMVDVFENYKKYELRGKKLMIVNREHFNHEQMSKKLLTMVDKILEDIPQQVQLKLPNLKKEPKKLKLPKLKKA
jgi:glycosyltransferase involved in cell wall biosynthesis